MVTKFRNFLHSRHHDHPVRKAIWQTMARMGATGMHSLPVSRRWVEIHRRDMPLHGLDASLAGLRLVQLSDIHYSPVVWKKYIEQYLDFVNQLRPDLVVITGDLITGGYRYAAKVAKILTRLSAPLGVVVTFGNHDYSMWGQRPKQAQKRGDYLEAAIEAEGIIVLRNELLHVTRSFATQYKKGNTFPTDDGALLLVGLDDEWTGKIDPDAGFHGLSSTQPIVCLNHNPVNTRELLQYPWQWMLAGHTHGRQVGHKGLQKAFLSKRYRHFTQGYYAVEGRHLYVNRGLSYGQRAQDWCRPEVTVFKLSVETPTSDAQSETVDTVEVSPAPERLP